MSKFLKSHSLDIWVRDRVRHHCKNKFDIGYSLQHALNTIYLFLEHMNDEFTMNGVARRMPNRKCDRVIRQYFFILEKLGFIEYSRENKKSIFYRVTDKFYDFIHYYSITYNRVIDEYKKKFRIV